MRCFQMSVTTEVRQASTLAVSQLEAVQLAAVHKRMLCMSVPGSKLLLLVG